MTQLLFYERPVALNRERHRNLKLEAVPGHFAFAAKTNALPIASTEFAEAARDYPIVFVGEEGGPFSVAALVGLQENQNLMVDADGRWASGTYVPAFARRYPFVLARTGGKDDERLTVCIDEVYPGLNAERGEALFDAEGKETPYLKRVLDFLQLFHGEAQRTTQFANRMKELGLLVPKVVNIDRKGGPRQAMRGVWIIDAQKYRGVDDARALELFRAGYTAWIEAHLISLGSLGRLVARMEGQARTAGDTPPSTAPAAPAAPAA